MTSLPDHDSRSREDTKVYYVKSFHGDVVCSRPGLRLIDFYVSVPGRAGMNSEVTGKSERDRQMEESPRSAIAAAVNPSTPQPQQDTKEKPKESK